MTTSILEFVVSFDTIDLQQTTIYHFFRTGKIMECITSLDAEEGDEDMYSYKIMLLGTGEQLNHIPHHKLE